LVGVNVDNTAGPTFYQQNLGSSFANPVPLRFPFGRGVFSVALGDVDGNGALDIYVVTSTTGGNPDDVLLLGQGAWKFVRTPVPAAGGSGSDAKALRLASGRTAFLVLNGREVKGPVQLITRASTG
jgi:hypothetical protein